MSKKAIIPPTGVSPLKGLTDRQIEHIRSIKENSQTVVLGPPGTGKTYVSVASACNLLLAGKIQQIIISRPSVGAGEALGYLPGDLKEKFAPWVKPVMRVFNQRIGITNTAHLLEEGTIRVEPFQFMLGETYEDAFILLDEAQNTSPEQMKCLLTRVGGDHSKLVIDGDIKQKYIKGHSGLGWLVDRVERYELEDRGVGFVEYDSADVVRGPVCKMWVEIMEKDYED